MDKMLASTSLHVENCGDLYRGLARLCREDREVPRAVILGVDGLGKAEMEFFSIVSRTRPRTYVYVYGDQRSASRIAAAIDLGATGEATDDVIRNLAATVTQPAVEALVSAQVPKDSPSSLAGLDHSAPTVSDEPPVTAPSEPAATALAEPSTKLADKPDGHQQVGDEASQDSVRVPWRRYKGGPVRKGPQQRKPPSDDAKATEHAKSRAPAHEPLLTEEELQALIGDDIAAITPDSHDAGEPSEQNDGGGPS